MEVEDILQHYGIPGMHWGHHKQSLRKTVSDRMKQRKENEKAYRDKLTAIGKNRSVNRSDAMRFRKRNHSLPVRVAGTAASVTAQVVLRDVLNGKAAQYSRMSKAEKIKRVKTIVSSTAVNVALDSALAKSASKRYNDQGKQIKGKKNPLMTKEDLILSGLKAASFGIAVSRLMIGWKASKVRAERRRNEEVFNQWGSHVLVQKVNQVIWRSPDGKTAVVI